VGEIAAACVAGIFSVEEAARIVALRARLMESCGRGEGTMLAVGLPEDQALALIARHDRTVTISAFNGPRSITLSGPRISLEAIAAELESQGVFARLVRVDHPFHHPLMRPASEAETALADLKPQPETIPFFQHVPAIAAPANRATLPIGDAEFASRYVLLRRLARWLISEQMSGWSSMPIPLWLIRPRNV
jgi:acyl transferase domain-containing protein